MPHLFVAISHHGFGHIAQTASVLNELVRQHPHNLEITIQSSAPLSKLQHRMPWDFNFIPYSADFGMLMRDAVTVLAKESYEAHRQFHDRWQRKIEEQCDILSSAKPDLVFANVPYLTLAAADQLKIPAIAMCSLNWADIFSHYCKDQYDIDSIHETMLDAYNSAVHFIKPQPSMPMPDLMNTLCVDPIATRGESRRHEIRKWLDLPRAKKIVLLSPGGFDIPIKLEQWPEHKDIHFLIPEHIAIQHPNMTPLPKTLKYPYLDIMCSCDALITKPGYGTFSESVCNGIPILFLRRPGWPEEPYLVEWLLLQNNGLEINNLDLLCGNINGALENLWSLKVEPKITLGHQQVVHLLQEFL